MPEGTIDDVIAEVSQLSGSMATALNALNTKFEGKTQDLQAQVNLLKGQGQPGTGSPTPTPTGIVTNPTNLVVQSGAQPGTQVATITAPMLTNPTFTLINPSGRYALNGSNLIVGLGSIDIANGSTDSVAIRATGSDGITQITEVKAITIEPPSATNQFDLNLVTGYYVGGGIADLTNVQASTITETHTTGQAETFGPNLVRRVDDGVRVSAEEARFVGRYSLVPNNANRIFVGDGWAEAGTTYDPVGGAAHASVQFPSPAIFTSPNIASGRRAQTLTEQPVDGQKLVWTYVFKRLPETAGAIMRMEWTGGFEEVLVQRTEADPNALQLVFPQNGYGQVPAEISVLNSSVVDNVVTVTIAKTMGAGEGGNSRVVIGTTLDNGPFVELGSQVVIANGAKSFKDVQNATVVDAADQYSLIGAPAAYLTAATGYFMIETNDIDYASCGGAGVAVAAPGAVVRIGATDVIRPKTPTTFEARGVEKPLGHSGWRGIVRTVVTWDATGWKAWSNGSKVAEGAGAWGLAGAVGLMRGVSGKIRRISGGSAKLTDTAGRTLSSLINRAFVRPGNALVPGTVTATFIDDFDVPSIQNRGGLWPATGTPGQPDYSGPDIEQIYKASWQANPALRWKPRQFFYQWDARGSDGNQINNEPQHYVDEEYAGSWQDAYDVTGGQLVMKVKRTVNLTAGEQAAVPDNPNTPGTKFAYVSAMLTTYGRNGQGGFEQAGGYWEWRARLPTFKGSWGAIWLYTPAGGGQEMDIEELYGVNPTQTTSAFHENNFQYNNGGPTEMGFDMGEQHHSYAMLWDTNTHQIHKYVDGVLIRTHPTSANFDQYPQHLLLNIAVHPGVIDAIGDAAIDAGEGVMEVDRVQVYRFGA